MSLTYSEQYCDLHVIPDRHNTGCRGELTKWYDHPAFAGVNVAETTGCLYLTVAICNAVNRVFENIDFDNVYVQLTANKLNSTNLGSNEITFNNCYFKAWKGINAKGQEATANYCVQNQSDITVNLNYCTFYAPRSSANYVDDVSRYVIDHCWTTLSQGDGFKMGTNVILKNSYVDNGGADPTAQAHADGVQFTSGTKFHIENFRSDCVSIGHIVSGPNQTHVLADGEIIEPEDIRLGNAGVYIDYESGPNLVLQEGIVKDIYSNGGSYTVCMYQSPSYVATEDTTVDPEKTYYNKSGVAYTNLTEFADGVTYYELVVHQLENVTVSNVNYGCSYLYGGFRDQSNRNFINENNAKAMTKAFVSSVWRENGKIKFLATNYTNEERTLNVITSVGTSSFTIPKCPTGSEYFQVGSPLHSVYTSYEDFPFDIEYEVPEGSWIVIFDGNVNNSANQIRYVNFDTSHYATIGALFEDICDAIREKENSSALINHVDIPDRIRSITTGDGGSSIKIVNGELIITNGLNNGNVEV